MVIFCWVWVSCSVVMTFLIVARMAHYRERIEHLEAVTVDLIEKSAIEKDSIRAMMMLERNEVRRLQTQINELERRGNSDRIASMEWRAFMTASTEDIRKAVSDVSASVSKLSKMEESK